MNADRRTVLAAALASGLVVGAALGVLVAVLGLPHAWNWAVIVAALIAAGGLWYRRDERRPS